MVANQGHVGMGKAVVEPFRKRQLTSVLFRRREKRSAGADDIPGMDGKVGAFFVQDLDQVRHATVGVRRDLAAVPQFSWCPGQ